MFASSTKVILAIFLSVSHFVVGLTGATVSTHMLDANESAQ